MARAPAFKCHAISFEVISIIKTKNVMIIFVEIHEKSEK
jgi:hypothetical protein